MASVTVEVSEFGGLVMSREPSLIRELRMLLNSQRVAALGTLGDDGSPFVSMVPYAIERTLGCLVIHVSALAAHTRYLRSQARVSLLICEPEQSGQPVHDLHRVTLSGQARILVKTNPYWQACKSAYLVRFPDAAFMIKLGDFQFFAIDIALGRHVSGFGAARSVDHDEIRNLLRADVPPEAAP